MSSIQLWPKQQEIFDSAKDQKKVAFLCEQRTGKTFLTLKMIERRMEQSEFVGVLVGLLNNKVSTWLKHLNELLPSLQVFTELDQFRKAKGHRLLLLHFEGLPPVIAKLVKYKKLTWAAVDEAHKLYNAGSKQSRAMARLSWIEWKLILTGTPMEKQPTDFFGQFKFLDPSVFGTNKGDFDEEWMDWKRVDLEGLRPNSPVFKEKMILQRILKGKAKFKEELMPDFMAKLKPFCYRIEKTDVGIIPPEVKLRPFKFDDDHMAVYDQMAKESWIELPNGDEVLAAMPATRNMKLRQLAAGFVYDEEQECHWLSKAKLRDAVKLFKSLPKPVVIFSSFVPELDWLEAQLRRLGYDVDRVSGKTKKALRPSIWAAFQSGQLDAVICHTKAGGVGVDLWKANHAIITSMDYSSIIWDQLKARMDSPKKSFAANIHVLSAVGTIDEDLFELIEVKGLTTKAVLQNLKGSRKWQKPRPKRKPKRNPTSPLSRSRSST